MKKIIDGLRYDSEKAVEIGAADSLGSEADSVTDFRYWEAKLYRTKRSGRYFIVGEGGPMTRFSQSAGQNTWTAGADLIPIGEDEARQWAERYLSPDIVEEYFTIQDA